MIAKEGSLADAKVSTPTYLQYSAYPLQQLAGALKVAMLLLPTRDAHIRFGLTPVTARHPCKVLQVVSLKQSWAAKAGM